MQTEKNIWLRMLSMILTLALLISCVPNQVYAMAGEALAGWLDANDTAVLQPNATPDPVLSTAHIVAEDESRRGETYKEYVMNNGLRLATVYPSAIHYEENGVWKDIDNTLVAAVSNGKAVYQNAAGAWNVRFPQTLSGSGMVGVTKDGHTVQFGMAGEMRSSGGVAVASVGTIGQTEAANALAVSGAQTTTAQIQQIDLTEVRAAAEHPETVLEKLNSRLTYANVYPNTNVVYDLQGNRLKESVVLQRYDADLWGYRYTLDTGDLVPVLREDQQIDLCHPETNEVVLTMPAPYMMDDNGETSYDVEVVLTQNGSKYLLSYYLPRAWLAETDRAWPVILDPVIQFAGNYSNVDDITVGENRNEAVGRAVIQCGYYEPLGAMRMYMQFLQLPPMTSADVIVDATIRMNKPYGSNASANIFVQNVTESWEQDTISWANQPTVNDAISDYVICQAAGHYTWNITSIVRDWYEIGNYGMMFRTPDAVEDAGVDNWKQFYSSEFNLLTNDIPLLTISYQNHNGLEDYWSYSSASAGRAGTGYVNLFTGNLTWVRDDLGFDGNRMPVSISHVYNSNDSQTNLFGMGYGWRTNYNQTIILSSGVYVWEDGDGTRHYFYEAKDSAGNTIANTYLDEDGMHLTLTTGGSGNQIYTLTDQMGNKSYFDGAGRLRKMENNQQTKSNISITYTTTTGKLINTITDGVDRVYQFHYTAGLLDKISYMGSGNTELTYVQYTYDSVDDCIDNHKDCKNLVEIIDKDGLYTTYSYEGHLLTRAENVPCKNADDEYEVDYYITYSYKEYPAETPVRPVAEVKEFDNTISESVPGNTVAFIYGTHFAEVTDHNGNEVYYQFNDWGNLIATHDSEGRSQFTKYALNDVNELYPNTAEPHQVIEISDVDGAAVNLLTNSSFEGSIDCWYKGSGGTDSVIVSDNSYQGEKSLMITNGNRAIGEYFWLQPGETYTFSAYIYAETDAEAYISFVSGMDSTTDISRFERTTGKWVRLQVSITNEGAMRDYIRPQITVTTGTVYVDCVQLEKAESASPYNAVENGDFEISYLNDYYVFNGWSDGTNEISEDYRNEDTAANAALGGGSLCLIGDPYAPKMIEQTHSIKGEKDDAFVLAGWAKANAAPLIEYQTGIDTGTINRTRAFGLKLIFKNEGVVIGEHYVSFDTDISADHWQYAAVTAVADDDFDSITIQMIYSYQVNVAYFDGIQLTEGGAGTRYEYDTNKNVVKETNILGEATEYVYWENGIDLKSVTPAVGSEVSYTYDAYHNVKTMVEITENPDGGNYTTTYLYEYDVYGNVLSTTISQTCDDPGYVPLVQKTVTTYTIDDPDTGNVAGNYVHTTTDGNGKTTTYGYDPQTGILLWTQYPEDTVSTRTNYEYDEMYRLKKTYATTDQNKQMSAEYVYAEDLLTSLVTKSTTYTYTYDKFDLRTSVKIGNRTLATYSYTDGDDGNHLLERLDYGNGNRVEYEYDNLGRVIREKYYETAEQEDPGRTIRYYYDNAGAIARMEDSATGIETVCYYDYAGRVGKLEETDGQSFYHVLLYAYDDNGNMIKMEEYINHQGANSDEVDKYNYYCDYFYDYKNRLEAVETENARKDYLYDHLDRVTNEVVSKVVVTGEGENTNKVITEVFENEYRYHSATVGGTSVTTYQVASKKTTSAHYANNLTYTYDDNGNIISISDGIKTITYEYDTANQLIRENNPYANCTWVLSYDGAGNILSKKEYAYNLVATNKLGSAPKTYSYGYGNAEWGDLLTSYNGKTITYDEIGNPLSDGTWTYTWKQGRQLASMTDGRYLWSYSYDANGMRISRNAGSTTYTYVYDGTQLIWMTDGLDQLHFTYDATGRPLTMEYHPVEHSGDSCGAYCGIYYYVTNLQGDVIAILDSSGNLNAEYTYDAWGNLIDNPDDTFSFIGYINPIRYRGYLYDRETGLYYLQSRYYNPEIGRFISADNYPSTGQGLTGNNMFAYCGNNPVSREDESGEFWLTAVIISAVVAGVISAAADAAIQVATTGEVDPGQVLIAGVSGAISGACALIPGGALATTAISVGVNAALNAGSYVVNQLRKGEAIDKKDFWVNVGIGAISGAAGNLFRFGSTGAIRNAGEKLVNKGMQKITNGVMNSATSTIKRGFQYIDRGISMIYQYAARAGVNSGFGSTTGCVINGIYSLVG